MNRHRLEHTAREVLPFVEPERFDMTEWQCGSTACAFGHECLSPFGKENGLRLVMSAPGWFRPTFDNEDGYKAVVAYYEISQTEARWIFSRLQYESPNPRPAEVAERIESLLACNP